MYIYIYIHIYCLIVHFTPINHLFRLPVIILYMHRSSSYREKNPSKWPDNDLLTRTILLINTLKWWLQKIHGIDCIKKPVWNINSPITPVNDFLQCFKISRGRSFHLTQPMELQTHLCALIDSCWAQTSLLHTPEQEDQPLPVSAAVCLQAVGCAILPKSWITTYCNYQLNNGKIITIT